MKTRIMASAILGIALLGTSILAATNPGLAANSDRRDEKEMGMTPRMECISLQRQFDTEIKSHATVAKAAEAKTLRSEAGRLCAGGKSEDGIIKLQHALKDLGVTPTEG